MDLRDSVKVVVKGLTLDPMTKAPIVILREEGGERMLPIWIGLLEATAVATALEGVAMPRPMTHDLLRNVLVDLGASVECVQVTEIRDSTYFARIHLRVEGELREIDSRPSDAIALALRTQSPIYVSNAVIDAAAATSPGEGEGQAAEPDPDFSRISRDKWGEMLEEMSPGDFKYKM